MTPSAGARPLSGVVEEVLTRAAADPERAAVVDQEGEHTYSALVTRAEEMLASLRAAGVGRGDRVAVVGPRSADLVAVLLALESLAAVYVPVDDGWPAGRIRAVLASVEPRCVLLRGTGPAVATAAATATELAIRTIAVPARGGPRNVLTPGGLDQETPRYIIHTSGSTGGPKGVVVVHRGLMNHLWSVVRHLGITRGDAVAATAPTGYVISVWQLLGALLGGARIVVVPEAATGHARKLVRAMDRGGVTIAELVPTTIDWVVREVRGAGGLSTLRWLLSTGEKLTSSTARDVLRGLPHVRLLNAYGASECSDDVAFHEVGPADLEAPVVPVGRPLPNITLHLFVDEAGKLRPTRPNEVGELWVGGACVGAGYWRDPDLTARAFREAPLDPNSPTGRIYRTGDLARFEAGVLHCVGRADRQVKIAGIRVELDEVESIISAIPGVRACAVVPAESPQGAGLEAHVQAPDLTDVELRRAALHHLPASTVPRRWHRVEALPRTSSGKVDYAAITRCR